MPARLFALWEQAQTADRLLHVVLADPFLLQPPVVGDELMVDGCFLIVQVSQILSPQPPSL
ncbi:MAG TPA: hypothetical protein VK879_21400 [Candidatus Sulfomarinibacteraceae bacterium]|nr:hypothetical protein [Candidatus Sulfomarinibacteraceae bacterium]